MALSRLTRGVVGGFFTLNARFALGHGCDWPSYVGRVNNSMKRWLQFLFLLLLFGTVTAQAQLVVTVSPAKGTGNKAVVKLGVRNGFTEKVESARAVCFLLDEHGKVVGRSTQWVIGGTKEKPPLASGATNTFHFVITTERTTSTNLAAQVNFSRVILEGGKLADVTKSVQIKSSGQ